VTVLPAAADIAPASPDPAALRALVARLVDTREEERLRVARKLHDELGQMLSALRLELGALAMSADSPEQAQRFTASAELVGASMATLRHISEDLRPLVLDDLGLHAALDWLADQASQRLGIEVTLRRDTEDHPADPRVATAIYRAVQEALDNVERHARATDVAITLRRQGETLELTVEDNGLGLPAGALDQATAWGLRTLDERMRALGGGLALENVRGGGARLRLVVPLQPARAPAAATVTPTAPTP
jgi:signal transduction histidine kinase